jgi:nucleotide-binding universal stress UspA family protein
MADFTVLVPLDGSKPAELALSFVAAIKPLGDLKLRLLSVLESDASVPGDEEKRREKVAADYLGEVGRHVETQEKVTVEYVRRGGVPYKEILEEADRQDVNLILMSTHGRTSFDPERLGSVADKVVRGASCPTLLVGSHASVPLAIERITVPLDGSRLAAEALPVARFFAEKFNAHLRLVRAVQYPSSLESDSIGSLVTDVVESMELTASLYLSEAKLELETTQPVETEVVSGPPTQALLMDLKENRPDLVIMTSHGHTGFIRWALGSVTDRLIRGPVPVLVLRPLEQVGERLGPLSKR